MKKSNLILGICLFTLSLFLGISCSTDLTTQESLVSKAKQQKLILVSPSGKVLAKSEKELQKDLLDFVNKKAKKKITEEVIVDQIQYSESKKASVAIINFSVKDKEYSILTPIFMAENVMILHDEHSLRFVEKHTSTSKKGSQTLTFKSSTSYKKGDSPVSDAADCINGDCCKWQTVVEGVEYNCGCPKVLTTNTSVILTTSDGCKISL